MTFKQRRTVALSLGIASMLFASSSMAATLKAYEKNSYSRIVIESPSSAPYSVDQSGNSYTITLSGDPIEGNSISLSRLQNASITNGALVMDVPSSNTVRHFKTGSKIIIDIAGKETSSSVSTTPPKTQKTSPPSAPRKDIPIKVVGEPKADPVEVPEVTASEALSDEPIVDIAYDHVVQITATETISVASFVRHNHLWVVVDKEDFLVTPQVQGKQKSLFSPFERIELVGATAFKTKLPNARPPLVFYAEGGGLIWRLILTTDMDKAKPEKRLKSSEDSLIWEDAHVQRVITVKDPVFKDDIIAITTDKVGAPINIPSDYIELSTLPSFMGVAFVPKTEDITVSITPEYAQISRNGGLNVSPEEDITLITAAPSNPVDAIPLEDYKDMKRIYRFDEWQLGGVENLTENERLLISSSSSKEQTKRIDDIIRLARLELSNGRAAEATGFLDFASDLLPDIKKSPEFIALRGAAHALTGQHDLAFSNFRDPLLEPYDEIGLWKAYSLAGLEDWNQAGQHLPQNVGLVSLYPPPLQQEISLVLAEIALRQGRVLDGEDLLSLVRDHEEILTASQQAPLNYLSGEAARQNGDIEDAIKYWDALTKSRDDLYRAKAGLALTRLLHDNGKITAEDAIDRLERLRYAWRGDDLETQINYRLGLAYLDNKEYIRGLTIMREAASRSPDPVLAQEIAAKMADAFNNVFTTDEIDNLDPLDTITLYEEFSELSPTGRDGIILVDNLAKRLIDIDLLGRAATLLKSQVDNELSGLEGARVALRLASVQLTDKKPSLALKSLTKAKNFITGNTSNEAFEIRQNVGLLEAMAYSKLKQPDSALVVLSRLTPNNKTLKMRADVAWRAERWQAASDALEELVNSASINLNRTLTDEQRDLILNWAITLNLSDNRYILNSVRDRFGDAMKKTSKYPEFEVITRPHKDVFLADRKTIENIVSEVDIFKGFLDSYKGQL